MAITIRDHYGNQLGVIERGPLADHTAPSLPWRVRTVVEAWLRAGRSVVWVGTETHHFPDRRFAKPISYSFFTVDGEPHDSTGRRMTAPHEFRCLDCHQRGIAEEWPVCQRCRDKRALRRERDRALAAAARREKRHETDRG